MRIILIYVLAFVLFSFSTIEIRAQVDIKNLEAQVDSIFSGTFGPTTPGAAVAITLNGELLLSKGYGLANMEHNVPITPESRFNIISGTKQFTAYAILKLEQQGLISIEDEVHKYLPELHNFGTPITIKHLLTHTSGIRQQTNLESMVGFWEGQVLTQARALELIFAQKELNFEPGSKFRYSDSGYTLLAKIIERITKEPFDEWMQKNVFDPKEMSNTSIINHYKKIIPNRAEAYDKNRNGYYRDTAGLWYFYGGSGVYSTVADLSLWLAFLDQPSSKDAVIVSRMEQQTILNNGKSIPWGFGLIINEGVGGQQQIWHTGDGSGYHAWIGRYPDVGLGIAVLTNLNSYRPVGAADKIAELFISNKAEPSQESSPINNDQFQSSILDELVGIYETDPIAIYYIRETWRFWKKGNTLYFNPNGSAKIPLHATSDSTFIIKNEPLTFTFHQNSAGHFDSLTFTAPDDGRIARKIGSNSFEFRISSAEDLVGNYYSPELKTEYEVFISEERVMVHHLSSQVNRRWKDFILQPMSPDYFYVDLASFMYVRFERSSEGTVTGIRVTDMLQRVENLLFVKR